MQLDTQNWKEFTIARLFDVSAGYYYSADDYEEGKTPYVSATATNNGIGQMINLKPDFEANKIVTGKVECKAFYQGKPFCATSDANIFSPKFKMTTNIGLFLASVITFNEADKWSYGRQCRIGDTNKIKIKLPVLCNSDKMPLIDKNKTYSDEGYIPNWQFMEDYIRSLHYKPISTKIKTEGIKELLVKKWKEFNIARLCKIDMGNKFDNDKMSYCSPTVNFVSRTANNNGVSDLVDEIPGVKPYPQNSVTVALGGSIGSCFLQTKPFYTGQNVAVLLFDKTISNKSKLFLATVFMNECKYKFVAFGRELNVHIRNDFSLYLPIKCHSDSRPVIDSSKTYSDDGYIPDWQFMEDYIDSLPYSDRLPV